MAVICRDIMNILEEFAPGYLAEPWDNVGLTVGEPDQEVKTILVALDALPEVVEEAIAIKADMLVTHHPLLLFQKVRNITTETPLGRIVYPLIRHKISAFCAHTNLDIAPGGVNDVLARLADLENVAILEETGAEALQKLVVFVPETHADVVREAIFSAGAGHIGNYSHCSFGTPGTGTFLPTEGTQPFLGTPGKLEAAKEIRIETILPRHRADAVVSAMLAAHPYEEVAYDLYDLAQKGKPYGIGRIGDLPEAIPFGRYASLLKERLGLDSIRLVGAPDTMIKRVGLCGGSAAGYLRQARRQGADVYLTGDIKFHEAQEALEMGLCIVDVTHYASESLIVPVLQMYLQQKASERGWALNIVCSRVNGQTFWSK